MASKRTHAEVADEPQTDAPAAQRARTDDTPPVAKGVGQLYCYDVGDGHYKIGRTSGDDGAHRRGALQTANPDPLTARKLWDDVPKISQFEADVHAMLADERVHAGGGTEFFKPADIDATVARIDALLVAHTAQCALSAMVEGAAHPTGGIPKVPPDEAQRWCTEYRLAKAAERQAKNAAELAALQLKRLMQADGTQQYGWFGTPITAQAKPMIKWSSVVTKRFDQAAFKKAHPELAAQYTIPTESFRFTVHQ